MKFAFFVTLILMFSTVAGAPAANTSYAGSVSTPLGPVRLGLDSARHQGTMTLQFEMVEMGVVKATQRMSITMRTVLRRSGASVKHERTIVDARMEEAGQVRIASELEGVAMTFTSTPSGHVQGPIMTVLPDGQSASLSVSEAGGAPVELQFEAGDILVGDVAARSPFLPSEAGVGLPQEIASALTQMIEWRLGGEVNHLGRRGYLINARTSFRKPIEIEGDRAAMSLSISGYSIVDAATGLGLRSATVGSLELLANDGTALQIRFRGEMEGHVEGVPSAAAHPAARAAPTLLKLSTSSTRSEDGSVGNYLFIDLRWVLSGSLGSGKGKLIVRHRGVGRSVALPWEIPRDVLNAGGGNDRDTGFELSSLGEAASWLPQASLDQLDVSFESAGDSR